MSAHPPPPHSRDLPEPGLYELRRARSVMRYWNQHPFEGRFKTLQTERAEELLRRAGLDPARVGLPARRTVSCHSLPSAIPSAHQPAARA